MKTVIFTADVSCAGRTVDVTFKVENGRGVVKDVYCILVLDGCHRHAKVDKMPKRRHDPWIDSKFGMNLITIRAGARIKQVEAIRFSKVWNKSSALVRKNASFVDWMKMNFKYAIAFEIEFSERFVDERLEDIVHDKVSSECLP